MKIPSFELATSTTRKYLSFPRSLISNLECSGDHSVFDKDACFGKIILVVYVDDIVLTGSDEHEETGLLGSKPVEIPMDPNVKTTDSQGEPLEDPVRYRRLVGKQIYLSITRTGISFNVGVLSEFMQNPITTHWDGALRVLKYLK
ncbi:PREDICTED: uncharacterized protein LOC109115017, partial [Nelumbo nucifera]|uniref:Uncharacterized protein LOC109115017 n=1 Tax=Nelumbo nucifera TaxID=4432 RepID=A0A1U8Q7Q9_NELNU